MSKSGNSSSAVSEYWRSIIFALYLHKVTDSCWRSWRLANFLGKPFLTVVLSAMDIALAAVLCSIAQVPVVKTTTTPHLIGGKTLHRSLEFFYSLTCKGRLWAITSPIRIMFTSSQWRSKKPTRVATTLVYIYINVLIHLTSLVPS